ncbi:DUF6414 family protein [Streptomyces griseoviridis]|uniref:Uncharacterized protein n=1 Tax=Streptomyces griseoviridis TaxID=45398 RepID=A0ABT9LF37_STRGD|nr:hypothetical protein [Streptomyces griseoviridis]MDP9681830.1 hypothetical protein [Streptomyces griseoviridis]GGS71766.1 hypothetical protein GCM10010240_00570 [Streptomyces griseoviridis]
MKTSVREYLYVDTPRVRTLLAQLSSGLPEERRSERTQRWNASLAGIDGPRNEEGANEQEVRSLADLHVAMLEEVAEYSQMILDVSEVSARSKNWHRGRIHKALRPSSLIRVTGPTAIVYPASFAASASAFDEFSEDKSFSVDMAKIVRSMYGDHLTLRVYPCGEEEWECQYSGVIADPGRYLAGEKEVLFSRLGADPQDWTTVATISRIPRRDTTSSEGHFERIAETLQDSFTDGRMNRRILEKMIQEASREMERMGLSEAPSWPAVSVIPLAVYREIQPSSITPELKLDD